MKSETPFEEAFLLFWGVVTLGGSFAMPCPGKRGGPEVLRILFCLRKCDVCSRWEVLRFVVPRVVLCCVVGMVAREDKRTTGTDVRSIRFHWVGLVGFIPSRRIVRQLFASKTTSRLLFFSFRLPSNLGPRTCVPHFAGRLHYCHRTTCTCCVIHRSLVSLSPAYTPEY